MGQQVRVRVLDPSNAVRFDMTIDPTQAVLAVLLAFLAVFAANLLLAPSQRRARVALRDKAKLLLLGFAHMVFSRDKSFKAAKQPDADLLLASAMPIRRKRIIFVRHGESLWNSVFNKAPMVLMPIRLARALFYEAIVLLELDSVLFDSPLSAAGRAQARELADFLARARDAPALLPADAQRDVFALTGDGRGVNGTRSVVVSSMLRRAVSTAWVALEGRIRKGGAHEPMHLHSALQEMSRNVDTLAIAHARAVPALSVVNGDARAVPDLTLCTSAQWHAGNKPVRAVALTRIAEFAGWCFERPEETVVVVGHSLLFKSMFALWLPRSAEHAAKAKKVVNCGVVGFTLAQGTLSDGKLHYRIEPSTISVIYGGFGGK